MSKVIKVIYRDGVLVPEKPLELEEGRELLVRIIDVEERRRILQKYRGILGKATQEEIDELLAEAEWEPL